MDEEELCGYCKKVFDREHWIGTECCIHCGAFLDNPPNIFRKENSGVKIKNGI